MEHAIGTRITLEVVETDNKTTCDECFFKEIEDCVKIGECLRNFRTDRKNIIYKEITEDKQ